MWWVQTLWGQLCTEISTKCLKRFILSKSLSPSTNYSALFARITITRSSLWAVISLSMLETRWSSQNVRVTLRSSLKSSLSNLANCKLLASTMLSGYWGKNASPKIGSPIRHHRESARTMARLRRIVRIRTRLRKNQTRTVNLQKWSRLIENWNSATENSARSWISGLHKATLKFKVPDYQHLPFLGRVSVSA